MAGMTSGLEVDIRAPSDLAPAERAAWADWAAADPARDSPYFHPRYAEIASEFAPRAGLAVLRQGDELVGFLPFQRRGGAIQPLGAPLTDYHGPILRPGAEVDLGQVLRRMGGEVMSFTGLTGAAPHAGAAVIRHRLTADLSGGFGAYMARRCADHARFFQTRRRHEKGLARDHGEVEFSYSRDPGDALDWIIDNKRRQYRRTGQHDIFACGWTARLLHRLAEETGEDFGPRFSVLRVDGRIASAVMSLTAGAASHLWFPAYNHDYARFGPGMLTTIRMLEAAAAEGCRAFDFGPGQESNKAYFCEPAAPVAEGRLVARPGRPSLTRALRDGLGARVARRLNVMSACETSFAGWTRAFASAAKAAAGLKHRASLILLGLPPTLFDLLELAPAA